MTAISKPTILLVPGAWMPSEQFDSLKNLLARENYESITVDHPSVGNEPADQTLDTDVANLRNTLTQLIDQDGKEVVLLLHSYGGIVGSCASEGFGTKQRADEGKRGGITAIIFVTAFLLQVGENLLDKLGGNWPAWMDIRDSKVYIDQAPEIGFPDLPQDEQKSWHARLTYTAVGAFEGTLTYEPWSQIPCAYFICENDTQLLPPFQEAMAVSIGATIHRITGGHNPFLSVSDQILKGIESVVAYT
ncbi:hypothetical protein E8E13_000678 [Curvularia kusanoi]|uniref:AB hydrolase-1 domain-containing protein n=1 Tax=Curvularia kusanoi TaxID=90978 RepID=A0A9P4W1V8_CURKU|nr:hypothetical protein E8E13_000678 [Curvularia kusanoi]